MAQCTRKIGEIVMTTGRPMPDAPADAVSHPDHYKGHTGIECMDALRSMMGERATTDYWWGCAFKYLWRWKGKNGLEDLKKCRQCVDYLIDEVEQGKGE